jgi:quercetin dioxygenase-like cupin family protein
MLSNKSGDVASQPVKMIEGLDVRGEVELKPMMEGDRMILLEITYAAGSASPGHAHSHESLCYIVSGSAHITVGKEAFTVNAGDVCRHPEDVPHSIEAIEDTTVVEIKSPAQPLAQFLGIQ